MFETLSLNKMLTNNEIAQARNIVLEASSAGESGAARITAEIIEPNIERINRATGQQNDARYLGYAVAYSISTVQYKRQLIEADAEFCGDPTVCE